MNLVGSFSTLYSYKLFPFTYPKTLFGTLSRAGHRARPRNDLGAKDVPGSALQVREADLVDRGRSVVTHPDALAVTVHTQALTVIDERHRVAFQNLALQVAEVDGLRLTVGDPERVPHRIVAQVRDVRDARRDLRAALDGTVSRGYAEEQAGVGLVTDHQGSVTHPGNGLQPAVEGSFAYGREHLVLAVPRGTQSAYLLLVALEDKINVTARRIQGNALAVQTRYARVLHIEGIGLPGKTYPVNSPSVGSGDEAASVGGETNPGQSLDAAGGDSGVLTHYRQIRGLFRGISSGIGSVQYSVTCSFTNLPR